MGDMSPNLSLKKSWVVCFIASLFFLFEFIQLSSFDALNHDIADYFHLNTAQVSILGSAFLWGNVLFLLPAGVLLDKYGSRRAVLVSLSVAVLGVLMFASTSHFAIAFFARLMTGVGNAFCFISLVVLVSRWFPANHQAFAMGVLVNMAFVGGMFAHTPLVMLIQIFGWKNIMWANVFLGLLIWLLIYLTVENYPSYRAAEFSKSSFENHGFSQSLKHILTIQNIAAGVYTSCLNLPIMVLCALWGMQYLQVVQHLSVYQASNVVSMIFLGSMIGCPIAGWCSDQWRKRKPIMWIGVLLSFILTIPLMMTQHIWSMMSLMSIFFILGLATSAQVLSYPLIAESNASAYSGRACSVASLIIMGGGMLAQMLFGYLLGLHAEASGQLSLEQFHCAMFLFPVSILLAIGSMFLLKETYCCHLVTES